jgi:hypothetical protein
VAENFPTVGQLQMDLAVLALSCNLSRVVTLMWSHAVSPTKIPGVTTIGNHDSSHYGTNPSSATGMQFIANRRWFMEQFAGLLQRMKATTYGDSNLLDHTVVYLCSDINDGDLHDHRSMPFLLAGGSKAGLRTGRFAGLHQQGPGRPERDPRQAAGLDRPGARRPARQLRLHGDGHRRPGRL